MSFSRSLTIHEAGHAVAAIRLGLYVKGIHLLTRAQLRRGDRIPLGGCEPLPAGSEGLMESTPYVNPDWIALVWPDGILPFLVDHKLAVADIAVCMAGPMAEARFSRRAASEIVMCGGGITDSRQVGKITALLPDPNRAYDEGWLLGRNLIRTHWEDVLAVANLIQHRGFTDGEEVHALLGERDQVNTPQP